MKALDAIEELTSKAVIWSVLIECDAATGGKVWTVILSDDHDRKGRAKTRKSLEDTAAAALIHLNQNCGHQLARWVKNL